MNGLEVLVERPERHYLFKNPESEKVKELQELELRAKLQETEQ